MKVVILRGVPGSGKSTYAKSLYLEPLSGWTVSADHYMVEAAGVYSFDPAKLPRCHALCLKSFLELVRGGERNVIVDNTNVTAAEIAPYYALAEAYGYDASIVTLRASAMECSWRNIHGVPAGTIARMEKSLNWSEQFFPKRWKMVSLDTTSE